VPDLFPGPVLASLRADPDHPAFEIGPRTVSRSNLLAMVRPLTAVLRDAGLGPGEGVGLVLSLSAEAYATHLAAHARGCRVVAARPGWSLGRLGHAVDRQVDAVIADRRWTRRHSRSTSARHPGKRSASSPTRSTPLPTTGCRLWPGA
jgi:fatty-acyl-CoA synthase